MIVRLRSVAPWLLVAATVKLAIAATVLELMTSTSAEPAYLAFLGPVVVSMSTAVGFVLATRRRENPIGWLLLANGLILALGAVTANYPLYGLVEGAPGDDARGAHPGRFRTGSDGDLDRRLDCELGVEPQTCGERR